jgi:glycosyltransferase involved in cell wall biosynthesis
MKSQKKNLVSIGMPVYNGESFIEEAINSLLSQDYAYFELIISDNASTDSTAEICKSYLKKDKRISYFRQKENIGAVKNFDFVLTQAKGKYFMWAACDDLWEPQFLSTMVQQIDRNRNCTIAFCKCDKIDSEGNKIRDYDQLGQIAAGSRFWSLINWFLLSSTEGKANLIYGLFPAEVIREIGGMGKQLIPFDELVVFQMLLKGPFRISRKLLFHKRKRAAKIEKKLGRKLTRKEIRKGSKLSRIVKANYRNLKRAKCYINIINKSLLPLSEKALVLVFVSVLLVYVQIKTFRL